MSENLPPPPIPPENNPPDLNPTPGGADQVPGIDPAQAETAQQPQIDVDPGAASVSGLKSVVALGRDKLASLASGVVSRAEDTLETRSQIIKAVREPAANKKEVVIHPFGRPESPHINPVNISTRTRLQKLSANREAKRRSQITDEVIERQRQEATIGGPVDEKNRDVRDARAYNSGKLSERERTEFKGDSDTSEGIARYTQDRSNRRALNQSKRNHGLRERRIGRRVRRSDRIEAGEDLIGRGLKRVARVGKALGGQNDGRYADSPNPEGPKKPTRQQEIDSWHQQYGISEADQFEFNTLQGIRAKHHAKQLSEERARQAEIAKGKPLNEIEVIRARRLSEDDVKKIDEEAAADANQIMAEKKYWGEIGDRNAALTIEKDQEAVRIYGELLAEARQELYKTDPTAQDVPELIKQQIRVKAESQAKEAIFGSNDKTGATESAEENGEEITVYEGMDLESKDALAKLRLRSLALDEKPEDETTFKKLMSRAHDEALDILKGLQDPVVREKFFKGIGISYPKYLKTLDKALAGDAESRKSLGKHHISPESLDQLSGREDSERENSLVSKEIKFLLLAGALKVAYRHMLHDRKS